MGRIIARAVSHVLEDPALRPASIRTPSEPSLARCMEAPNVMKELYLFHGKYIDREIFEVGLDVASPHILRNRRHRLGRHVRGSGRRSLGRSH